MKHDKKLDNFN